MCGLFWGVRNSSVEVIAVWERFNEKGVPLELRTWILLRSVSEGRVTMSS